MKNNKVFFLVLFQLFFLNVFSQIGIGTSTPDESAILDLSSTTQGLLLPRMTTLQQVALNNPAIGLMIYNTTTGQIETNKGDGFGGDLWSSTATIGTTAPVGTNTTQLATTAFVMENSGKYVSVNEIIPATTVSLSEEVIAGMTVTPPAGTYLVSFDSQFNNEVTTVTTIVNETVSSQQANTDLARVKNQLSSMSSTNYFLSSFDNQTLLPGVFLSFSATVISNTLTLDAQGNPDAIFVFNILGALHAAPGTSVILTNGAKACNVFWNIDGAVTLSNNANMKGTILCFAGSIDIREGANLEGRLLTQQGAITLSYSTVTLPEGTSSINLGILQYFSIFTSAGAITNSGISTIIGNVGTHAGLIVGFTPTMVIGTISTEGVPPISIPSSSTITTIVDNINNIPATFSIYQNGVLIPSSSKTLNSDAKAANISLHAVATTNGSQPIEVRWKTGSDKLTLGNRTLTVVKVH